MHSRPPRAFLCLTAAAALAAAGAAREEVIEVRSPDAVVSAPLHVANLNRLGAAALGGTPGQNSSFVNAFDRRLDTAYEAREPGPAAILIGFARPQALRTLRLPGAEAPFRWTLHAAASFRDLEDPTLLRELVPERPGRAAGAWDEVKLPGEPLHALRLTLIPAAGAHARLVECNLIGDQTLEALNLNPKSQYLTLNEATHLDVTGYFSGGETRTIRAPGLSWVVSPRTAARVVGNRITATRRGPLEVSVRLGKLLSPPFPFEAVEGD